MGGFGSGRPAERQTTRAFNRLGIGDVKRHGCFRPGATFRWEWDDGQTIRFRCDSPERLVFDYRIRRPGQPWHDVSTGVRVERTPCHLGGERPWFICPGCGERRAHLYVAFRIACRECLGLTYPRCRMSGSPMEVARHRLEALAREIGLSDAEAFPGGEPTPWPRKPKGKHWRTYREWLERWQEAEEEWHEAFRSGLAAVLERRT